MKRNKRLDDASKLPNYFAIIAIAPAFLSVMAYELVEYFVNYNNPDYRPVVGLGMIIPMALLMELYTFFLSRHLNRKVNTLANAINQVAGGNYDVTLDVKKAAPMPDVAENFNKMTAELKSVHTLRNDFINDFSHEFKTPITSINGFANLLLETEVTEEERRQYLTIIAEESSRLSTLAEETLMMSRLDSQQNIIDQEWYALDEQIRQNLILLSKDWGAKLIEIDTDLNPVSYLGNPALMSHIWLNLISNAIKFTPGHGRIAVNLKESGGKIYVSVADNGKGMTKEETSRIFNKYYQADASHATKGLGLGLSIAHRIVELCGGEIQVASTPGEGSTFTVILPTDVSR